MRLPGRLRADPQMRLNSIMSKRHQRAPVNCIKSREPRARRSNNGRPPYLRVLPGPLIGALRHTWPLAIVANEIVFPSKCISIARNRRLSTIADSPPDPRVPHHRPTVPN
ncbi:hypothetical protein GWI33_013981 [Rhynchophorus ferrugineus]|uniref:Uncharacterized protein n=1 Tax=Rhynchophorus ferrugineus TaxID=354439 RepID=A0A834I605_RHYFE|nr:hypothetical protein GWI33_013981 [Rhynchophorus ferrugineus]